LVFEKVEDFGRFLVVREWAKSANWTANNRDMRRYRMEYYRCVKNTFILEINIHIDDDYLHLKCKSTYIRQAVDVTFFLIVLEYSVEEGMCVNMNEKHD
jgi:hypothetical protein